MPTNFRAGVILGMGLSLIAWATADHVLTAWAAPPRKPPEAAYRAPADSDGDSVPDSRDNCPNTPNPDQWDTDIDGIGDACDTCHDLDKDGFATSSYPPSRCPLDNCPDQYNPDQTDGDGDGVGDACDLYPRTIPNVRVDATGCPVYIIADFDRDGDVDRDDFRVFQRCYSGSNVPAVPGCENIGVIPGW